MSSAQLRYPPFGGTVAIVDDFNIGSIDNTGVRHQIWSQTEFETTSVRVHISGRPVLELNINEFNRMMDDFFKSRLDPNIEIPNGNHVIDNQGYIIGVLTRHCQAKKLKYGVQTVKVHVSGEPYKLMKDKNWLEAIRLNSGPIVSTDDADPSIPDRWARERPPRRGRGREQAHYYLGNTSRE